MTVGIDIGGTNVKAGLVDENGEIVDRIRISTVDESDSGFEAFVRRLADVIDNFRDLAGTGGIRGVGIGAPNGNHFSGCIEHAPNLPWKGILPLCEAIANKCGDPVILTNDANAAAMGEKIYGGARQMEDFVVLTLGTGLGSGFYVHGQILYGHDGFAGELGHSSVYHNGRECTCGRRGCLEAYVSIRGILYTYRRLTGRDTEGMSPLDLYRLTQEGDADAKEAFATTGRILGLKLADIACYTSPEAIFLAGGLSRAGDLIIRSARESMEAHIHNIYKGKIQLLFSELPDNNAAILGAAALLQSRR